VGFPARLLGADEQVVLDLRPHWCVLGWPSVTTAAAVGFTASIFIVFPDAPAGVAYALIALVGLSVLWLAQRALRRAATSIVVTTGRVLRRSGVLSRTTLEIRLERINELSSHQSVGGRILGSGEVLVEVGGETGVVVLDHVPHPQAVQSVISGQVSRRHRAVHTPAFEVRMPEPETPPTGTPARTDGPSNAAERMVQLQELRRRGIVDEQEYQAKRRELLQEL
jgi:uncharacterized membrane protein YdbT with pleckstrin-like domain